MGYYPYNHKTLWLCGFATSCGKIKSSHLDYHSVHGHQTWEDDEIPWRYPYHKVIQTFDHVVLHSHVTNENHYFSTYECAYGHQTWQGSNLPCCVPFHKVIWFFDNVVLRCHVINKNHYISTTIVSMATKHGRILTSIDQFLPVKSHDPLIPWPWKIGDSRTRGGSVCKSLSHHRLLVTVVFYLKFFRIMKLGIDF